LSVRVLCPLAELADGEARGFGPFDGSRVKVVVVRRGDEVRAYWDACPHYGGTPMAWRTNAYLNAAGDRIVCASHGAEFDIDTGQCTLGAALGTSLPLAPVAVDERGDIIFEA
jgi:nitrite reductase/ring-hydroxylating ferredoxin subunit